MSTSSTIRSARYAIMWPSSRRARDRGASRQFGRARDFASDAAQEAEQAMRDNLAASLILAVGLGVVVGYFIRRGTE